MNFLKELCSVNAVSGKENKIAEFILNTIKPYCDDVNIDNIGNVVGFVDNNASVNVMITAHIDQIGLVVKKIDKDGFVFFGAVGGVSESILPTQEVVIHGKKDVFGIIGAKPPHLQTDTEAKNTLDNMYIDCGYSYDEISKIVTIGDVISFKSNFNELCNDYLTSKSLDNRVSVYVITECLKRLYKEQLPFNMTYLYSVQEEAGGRGALVATDAIKPDYAIVVDVTFGISPYTNNEFGFETDGCITLAVGPNLDRIFTDKFIKTCDENEINYCKEVCEASTGTDAWKIQVSGKGTKCALVSVPIKYMHTTVETVNKRSISMAIDAICQTLKGGVLDA